MKHFKTLTLMSRFNSQEHNSQKGSKLVNTLSRPLKEHPLIQHTQLIVFQNREIQLQFFAGNTHKFHSQGLKYTRERERERETLKATVLPSYRNAVAFRALQLKLFV